MSKSVRLKDYLAAEVEVRATDENRSFANMVERLLEQALGLRGIVIETDAPEDIVGVLASRNAGPKDARREPSPSSVHRFPEAKIKKRAHPCRHHVPPHRVCDYCDVAT